MKEMYIVYCSYPYTDAPERRKKEITEIGRRLWESGGLLPLIPHNIFDELYDLPPGYSHPEIAIAELFLISHCHAFAYDPQQISAGVNWEKSFADLIGKPIFTFDELLNGRRPTSTEGEARFKFRIVPSPSETQGREQVSVEKGKKDDFGKPMVDLLIPEFIEDLAKVLTMGAQKYGLENWKHNLEKRRILAALYRHLLQYHKGEVYDEESGLNHLCHIAINAMFLYWYDEVRSKGLREMLKEDLKK